MPDDAVDLVSLMPFAADIGMRIESATADEVVGRLDWAPRLCTTAGVMHGGVLMSFADTLGAGVTFLGLPDGATTEMFRPVLGGSVRGVAETVHRGRTVVTAVTRLYDDNDKLVAQTTQIQAVRAASG